ncbi:hypothetical protein [Thermogymnomonas acidicola]|uniref:molybdopterin-binding protein n=1 Tax=Thermogymnomonas acidicola TaxID=399579 RepID=UPI001396AB33|nr:molybdopterin-binding protein [Thermogymnomonas acidicola]
MGERCGEGGEDLRAGTVIVRAGEVLRPESIGALLSCGVREVEAFSRIRVGVVSTGDELLEGLIENSTQPEIVSFFSSRFTEVEAIGPVRDRPSEIYEAVLGSVERNNITVVTGGSSVGEHDHSRVSVSSMGEEVFSGIGLKPGRTLSLYRVKGRPVFVISGLPGAAIVSLRPFVAFLLQALMKSKPRVLHVDRLAGLQIGPDEAWAVPLDLAWSGQGIAMMPMHNRGGTHRLSLVSRAMWTLYVDGSCSDAFLMEAGGIDRTIV